MPALQSLRLTLTGDHLHVVGTDLDLTIEVDTTVAGQGDGVVLVPARLTTDIVRSLEPGAVQIEATDDEVRLTAGRSAFSVRHVPADEFPRVATAAAEPVTLAATELADALRQVVPAASQDNAVAVITGVLFAAEGDGLRLVATDRYRLAKRDLPGFDVLREGQRVLVPSRALGEVQRLLAAGGDVALRLGEREVTFEVGDVKITTRLVEGDFPNYQGLIAASYPNRLIVGKEALLDAVKRVKLLVRDVHTPVRIALSSDSIRLEVRDTETGNAVEEVDAKYEGAEMTVAFNPGFLADGAEVVQGDEVLIEIMDAMKASVLRSLEDASYQYLLMPVRVP